jgi:hypothetical protein
MLDTSDESFGEEMLNTREEGYQEILAKVRNLGNNRGRSIQFSA